MTASEAAATQVRVEKPPRVVCLIVNFDRTEETLICLESLRTGTEQDYLAVVLDASGDEKLAAEVRARFPKARLTPLRENGGYTGNNNAGLRLAAGYKPEWVFLLNEDTRLAPDCLEVLLAAGGTDPRIGVVGPTVCHESHPNLIQSAGGKLTAAWEAAHLDQNMPVPATPGEPRPVDWLVGCAVMVRWRAVEEAGLLDDRFYIYYEEVEWCLRMAKLGWKRLHIPRARLWHKGVAPDYRPGPGVTYYSARNRLLFMAKHAAPWPAKARAWAEFARTLVSWTLRPKWRAMRPHRDALVQALVDYLRGRTGRQRAVR